MLPYFISDKYRQLANALRLAISGLDKHLPHQDIQGPAQTVEMLQNKQKVEEEKRKEETLKETNKIIQQMEETTRKQREMLDAALAAQKDQKMEQQFRMMNDNIASITNSNRE